MSPSYNVPIPPRTATVSGDSHDTDSPHVMLLSSRMDNVAPVAELVRRLHAEHGFFTTAFIYASSDSTV